MSRVAVQLREAYSLQGDRFDADKGILYGVKILGLKSQNGKRYSPQAVAKAIPLIEAARVYVDHAPRQAGISGPPAGRSVKDRFGRFENVKINTSGEAVGDFRYRKKHSYTEQFEDDYQNDPMGIGFSIDAFGYGVKQSDGTMLVDEIARMYSVDLVDNPATVAGLWEQTYMDPLDPNAVSTGTGGGGDWKMQAAELVKAFATELANGTMDKASAKKKMMQVMKLLDDGETPTMDDGTLTEQLRQIPLPEVRSAVARLEGMMLRERTERRREQAKQAGLPETAISGYFLEQLGRVSDAELPSLINDRRQLLAGIQGRQPVSVLPSAGTQPAGVPQTKDIKELRAHYFGANN